MSPYHSRTHAPRAFPQPQCESIGARRKISGMEGTGVLHMESDPFWPVSYVVSSGFDDDGHALSVGLLKAPVHVIAAALSARECRIIDDRNGRRLEVIVTRHELGADEADIMLSAAENDAALD